MVFLQLRILFLILGFLGGEELTIAHMWKSEDNLHK